jgi:hypothetical protein
MDTTNILQKINVHKAPPMVGLVVNESHNIWEVKSLKLTQKNELYHICM